MENGNMKIVHAIMKGHMPLKWNKLLYNESLFLTAIRESPLVGISTHRDIYAHTISTGHCERPSNIPNIPNGAWHSGLHQRRSDRSPVDHKHRDYSDSNNHHRLKSFYTNQTPLREFFSLRSSVSSASWWSLFLKDDQKINCTRFLIGSITTKNGNIQNQNSKSQSVLPLI